MRIFYASDTTPNANLRGSNLWRDNLLLPLRDLGHEVVEFDYDLSDTFAHLDTRSDRDASFITANRPRVSSILFDQIVRAHEAHPIDLLFTYFYDACVLPETIDKIRALGIVTVNWYCNGSYQLHLVEQIAPHYDWCLVPERFRLEDYRRLGARPIYCQEAANPNVYRPVDAAIDHEATFVGMAYGERPRAVRTLVDRGLPVRVYGPGWDRCLPKSAAHRAARGLKSMLDRSYEAPPTLPRSVVGPAVSDAEMIALFSRSKVNIGFSAVGSGGSGAERILQVRLREFEIPMSGGFYVVEYMPEIEEFYEVGSEIVCYRDFDDLADKIEFYLKHDDEREAIRRRGHARARRDHTWQKRFQAVFEQIGLAPSGDTPTGAETGVA